MEETSKKNQTSQPEEPKSELEQQELKEVAGGLKEHVRIDGVPLVSAEDQPPKELIDAMKPFKPNPMIIVK